MFFSNQAHIFSIIYKSSSVERKMASRSLLIQFLTILQISFWGFVLIDFLCYSIREMQKNSSESFFSQSYVFSSFDFKIPALVKGNSLSEALIFALTNPQYDDRLLIELQVQYMKIPSSEDRENIVYINCSECQKQFLYTTCSPQVWAWNFHVLNL